MGAQFSESDFKNSSTAEAEEMREKAPAIVKRLVGRLPASLKTSAAWAEAFASLATPASCESSAPI